MQLIDPNERDPGKLRAALEELVETDPASVSEVSRHDVTLHLGSSVPVVGRIIGVFRRILDADLAAIPPDFRQKLAREIHRTQSELQRVRELDPHGHSAEDILSSWQDVYGSAYENLAPILAHIGADPAGLDDLKRQADTAVREITSRKKRVAAIEGEASTALKEIRTAAAEAGVSQHAVIFDKAAERHRKASRWWLWVSVALAGVTLWLAWQMAGQAADRDLAETIQFVAARFVLFGVLSYALVSSVRTYRAEAHNQVVNAHRKDALSTFKTFTAASSDDATRDAVLMHATQCIFSHRPSGFGQREDDSAPQSQVLGLTRNVLPKASE